MRRLSRHHLLVLGVPRRTRVGGRRGTSARLPRCWSSLAAAGASATSGRLRLAAALAATLASATSGASTRLPRCWSPLAAAVVAVVIAAREGNDRFRLHGVIKRDDRLNVGVGKPLLFDLLVRERVWPSMRAQVVSFQELGSLL